MNDTVDDPSCNVVYQRSPEIGSTTTWLCLWTLSNATVLFRPTHFKVGGMTGGMFRDLDVSLGTQQSLATSSGVLGQ